ncbi:hypothetical protein IGI04_004612 [Brassica rapa subsp. trilocularis]|uniref:Protein kinase domain-containing protein n=1 Tax=Brassica rapa subsp. trilocularis TaxID=1813537 RepID=A0ABQ7NBM1_BRACM|nr:hypothetical protein IGI04_004612 [Brassica rapa subsp. trilocularis]
MAATKIFVSCFQSNGFLDLEDFWDDLPVSRLEVVWKSSGLLGSLLTKSSRLPGSRLDFQEVVWTSRKSSGLLESRLDFFERFGKFLIIWYSSSTNLKVFQIWKTSGTTLLVSRLEVIWKSSGSRLDFLKVVWTSCKVVWKSSELPKSLLAKSSELPGSRLDFLEVTTYNSVVHETTEIRLKCKSSGEVKLLKLSIDDLTFSRLRLQISKSIAKITSALTRRLPGKSSTARRLKGKSSTARRLPNYLAYIRLFQAHRITNGSHPPIIVSFYDSMNHKNFRIKILSFFSSLWRENERYVVSIKSFKLVVHGGCGIDDNGNLLSVALQLKYVFFFLCSHSSSSSSSRIHFEVDPITEQLITILRLSGAMMGICLMKRCCSRLLFLSLFCALMNQNEAISPDGEALMSFRSVVSSADGVVGKWRPEDPDPCNWKGVTCDAKTKRVIALSLTHHKLIGPLPPELGKLDQLRILMLHNNNLYGSIPTALGNCTSLEEIYLHNNFFTGPIPSEMGNLSMLKNLDISNNDLTGAIPVSLGQLEKLTSFNVSNNFLVGKIPSDGLLAQFSKDCFIGNFKLCGKKIDMECPDENSSTGSRSTGGGKTGKLLISASATVGGLLLVALMCFWGCFLYKKLGRDESKSLAIEVGGGASIVMFHGDLPYASKDIIKKLEALNEEHIIGCGGFGTVYKLDMEDGNVFALKRIVKLNGGFDRFFERELEILGSIKHRYLVNLRGYCNSPTSKLLLYDYLPGGSLDQALHEYMQSGRATEKTDVYSFGVLILEVLSGKLPTDTSYIEKGYNVVGWLNFLISENRPREIVDRSCEGVETESLDALLSIATKCASSSPDERPTMHRVVQLLESQVMSPCPSDFYDSSSD